MDCLTADNDVSNTTVFKGAEMTKTKVKKIFSSTNAKGYLLLDTKCVSY